MSIDLKRLPLETCFRLAKLYGFDGIEIFGSRSHLYPYDCTQEVAESILNYQSQYGIEVPMYTPNAINLPVCLCSSNASERKDGVSYYQQAIKVAKAIGAKRVLVVADHPGYAISRKTAWKYLVDSMKQICEFAHGSDIEVTIEPLTPMESPVVTTVDDCLELIEAVSDDHLYAMLDIVPPTVTQEPLSKYFDMLGDRLNYIHISNTDGKTDAHTRLEEGVLPIIDVIDVFKHHGYNGYVTAELYSENYRDPELLLANTARIINEIKEKLEL